MTRCTHLLPGLLLALLSTQIILPSESTAQVAIGKEFVVALPSFWKQIDLGYPGTLQITMMCSRETNFSIKWSGPTGSVIDYGTITGGNRVTIQPPLFNVPTFIQPNDNRNIDPVNQRSFYIQTDQPVAVFAHYDEYRDGVSYTATYPIAPISGYDTSFLGLTYSGFIADHSGMLITAAEDGTQVTFTPSVEWETPGQTKDTTVTFTMQKYQVYQLLSRGKGIGKQSDLTGTTIRSTKPIGITAFNITSSVHNTLKDTIVYIWNQQLQKIDTIPTEVNTEPSSIGWKTSAMADYMPGIRNAGTVFYATPLHPQPASDVRILALDDDTEVWVNGILDSVLVKGKWSDYPITTATKFETSKPTLAMMLTRSGNNPVRDTVLRLNPAMPNVRDTVKVIYGNPGMAWLPPVNLYKATLQWVTPLIAHRRTPIPGKDSILLYPWAHFAMITAPVSTLSSVRLDGNPVKFTFPHQDGFYASAIVPVTTRQHLLTADEPISCIAYGYGYNDGYAVTSAEALRAVGRVMTDSILGSTCDSTIEVDFTLANIGNMNYRIDSIKADGIEIRSIRSPIGFPTEMPPGRVLDGKLILKLPQTRSYTGHILVYTDIDVFTVLRIPFRIVRDSAHVSILGSVDFGRVPESQTSVDTLIELRNDGLNDITITSLSFDDPRFTVTEPATPFSIPPGGTRLIGVRLTPRPGVPERGSLRIVGQPCFSPVDVAFSGFKGSGPLLGMPRIFEYPPALCASPGPRDTVIHVESIGEEPLELTSVRIIGPDNAMFALLRNPAPVTLPPGARDSIIVRYTPTTYARHQAYLELSTNARNATDPLAISLSGRLDTATAAPNRRTIDFDTILSCDDPIERTFSMMNNGTVEALISQIVSDPSLPFSVVQTGPLSIAPFGGDRSVTIRFEPTADGDFEGTFRFVGEPCGINEEITVRGTRISPALSASTATLDFDTLYHCDAPVEATFTLTNNGLTRDTIARFSPQGSDAFTLLDPTFPVELAPGESRTVRVRFTPTAAGSFGGSYDFQWQPCGNSTVVGVNAVVIDPQIALSATSLSFGQVAVDGGEVTRNVTLTNDSPKSRTFSSLDFGGDTRYRLVSPSTPITLAAGESVELVVGFDPSEIGTSEITATLLSDGPCADMATIALSGEGTGIETITARFTIAVPDDLSGAIDDVVDIPIEMRDGVNLDAAGLATLRLQLSWRASMLYPHGFTPAAGLSGTIVEDEIVGENRVVTLDLSGTSFPSNGRIGTIKALVLLGDRLTTEITIDSVSVTPTVDRIWSIAVDNGLFTTEGICRLDGDRLIGFGTALKIIGLRPNPVNAAAEVDFVAEGDEEVRFRLIDAGGVERKVVTAGRLDAGAYTVALDVSDLPTGSYVCLLEAGGKSDNISIIVRR